MEYSDELQDHRGLFPNCPSCPGCPRPEISDEKRNMVTSYFAGFLVLFYILLFYFRFITFRILLKRIFINIFFSSNCCYCYKVCNCLVDVN